MKALFLLSVLFLVPTTASADDLLCTGIGWAGSREFEATVVFRLNQETLEASVNTHNGLASGIAKAQPDLYLGELLTEQGVRYWFNLHRYSGELYFGLNAEDGRAIGKGEFLGTCERARPKF